MGISQQRFLVVRTNHFGFASWIITININDPTLLDLPSSKKNPNNQPTQKNRTFPETDSSPLKINHCKIHVCLGTLPIFNGWPVRFRECSPLPKLVYKQTPSPEKVVMAPQAVSETWSFVSKRFLGRSNKNQGHFLSTVSTPPKTHTGTPIQTRNESMAPRNRMGPSSSTHPGLKDHGWWRHVFGRLADDE